ncbi:MAG: nicotinate (nicotinamide) nucleotide adenylyltransferase [Verrucomicrobiota bacterium]
MTAADSCSKPRVAVLGGSFDPIHLGHLEMARAVQEAYRFDRILFMPCFVSPFKKGTVATTEERLAMLELALRDFPLEGGEINQWEIGRSSPSYTWQTVEHLSASEPETEWSWVVGTDQWEQIESWAESEKLRELLRFIVLTRDGDSVRSRPGWSYLALPFSHPASSTAIRADFDAGRRWLTRGVIGFCEENDLYQ